MKTNIHLLQLLVNSDQLRKYAVWLRLKHSFSNSCIFNYNISSLGKKTGLSRTSIRKHVAFFLENGWCKMHGKNLLFISHENILQLYKIKLRKPTKINKTTAITTTVNNLRFELLKDKQRKFEYLKKVSRDLRNPKGKGALERFKKASAFFKKFPSLKPLSESAKNLNLKISNGALGNIINKSSSTISNLIKLKEQEGKVQVIRKRSVIAKKLFGAPTIGYQHYFYMGYIVRVECNEYIFFN